MNFFFFNIVLFTISYILDYIAIHIFGLVEWSDSYIYYLIIINIPVSSFATYKLMPKIKEFLSL